METVLAFPTQAEDVSQQNWLLINSTRSHLGGLDKLVDVLLRRVSREQHDGGIFEQTFC